MIKYRTFSDMVTVIGRMVGNEGATKQNLIKDNLNRWYDFYASMFRWPSLLIAEESSISAVSGQDIIYLPKFFERVYFIKPHRLDHVPPQLTIDGFFKRFGDHDTTTGIITDYARIGEFARKVPFHSSAEKLTLVSDNASDTSTVVVKGKSSGGSTGLSEEVTLSGTSSVETTNTYSDIFSISSDGQNSGVITITGSSSSLEYAEISPTERTVRYVGLRLRFVPNKAETISVFGKRKVNLLNFDNDVPEIPVSSALVEIGISEFFAHQRKWQEAAAYHRGNAQVMIDQLTKDIQEEDVLDQSMPDQVLSRSVPNRGRRSGSIVVVTNSG